MKRFLVAAFVLLTFVPQVWAQGADPQPAQALADGLKDYEGLVKAVTAIKEVSTLRYSGNGMVLVWVEMGTTTHPNNLGKIMGDIAQAAAPHAIGLKHLTITHSFKFVGQPPQDGLKVVYAGETVRGAEKNKAVYRAWFNEADTVTILPIYAPHAKLHCRGDAPAKLCAAIR